MFIGLRGVAFTSPEAANTNYWVRAEGQLLSRSGTYQSLAEVTINSISATLVSGSAVVTADTTNLQASFFIEGTGIDTGATILSIDSSTQFTMSSVATSSGTIVMNYSFYSLGDGTTFGIGSDSRFTCYNIDSATGGAVKIPSLPEDQDLSSTAKMPAVEGATTVFVSKSNLFKNLGVNIGANPTSASLSNKSQAIIYGSFTADTTLTFSSVTNLTSLGFGITNTNANELTFVGITFEFKDSELPDGVSFESNALTFPADSAVEYNMIAIRFRGSAFSAKIELAQE